MGEHKHLNADTNNLNPHEVSLGKYLRALARPLSRATMQAYYYDRNGTLRRRPL